METCCRDTAIARRELAWWELALTSLRSWKLVILVSSVSFVSSVSSGSFVSPISLYLRDSRILRILVILGILVSLVSPGFPVSLYPRDPWYPRDPGILEILVILAMFQCRYPAETRIDIQHRLLPARCFFDYRGCGSEREAAFSCLLYPSCCRALIHK